MKNRDLCSNSKKHECYPLSAYPGSIPCSSGRLDVEPLSGDNGAMTADSTLSDRTHEGRASVAGGAEEGLAIVGADERAGGSLVVLRGLRMGRATLMTIVRTTVRAAVRGTTVRRTVARGTVVRGLGVRSTDRRTAVRADVVLEAGVLAVRGRGSAESSRVLLTSVGVWGGGVQDRVGLGAGRRAGARGGAGLVVASLAVARVEEIRVAVTLVALTLNTSFDGGTGSGEVDVFAFDSLTFTGAVDVGNEYGRQLVEAHGLAVGGSVVGELAVLFAISTTSTNIDLSTVHVHLAVANLVEPRPGNESLAIGSVGRDLEVVGFVDGTSAEDGVDNVEVVTLVVREGNLTGTTLVSSTAGHGHLVGLALRIVGGGVEGVVGVALAREVFTTGRQRVGVRVILLSLGILVQGAANGKWLAQLHVCRD